jgi:hypothetical protein
MTTKTWSECGKPPLAVEEEPLEPVDPELELPLPPVPLESGALPLVTPVLEALEADPAAHAQRNTERTITSSTRVLCLIIK